MVSQEQKTRKAKRNTTKKAARRSKKKDLRRDHVPWCYKTATEKEAVALCQSIGIYGDWVLAKMIHVVLAHRDLNACLHRGFHIPITWWGVEVGVSDETIRKRLVTLVDLDLLHRGQQYNHAGMFDGPDQSKTLTFKGAIRDAIVAKARQFLLAKRQLVRGVCNNLSIVQLRDSWTTLFSYATKQINKVGQSIWGVYRRLEKLGIIQKDALTGKFMPTIAAFTSGLARMNAWGRLQINTPLVADWAKAGRSL